MTEFSEIWTNHEGATWEIHHDDKAGVVTYVQNEEVFIDPPKWPWPYEYVTTVLHAHGYSLTPGTRIDKVRDNG